MSTKELLTYLHPSMRNAPPHSGCASISRGCMEANKRFHRAVKCKHRAEFETDHVNKYLFRTCLEASLWTLERSE